MNGPVKLEWSMFSPHANPDQPVRFYEILDMLFEFDQQTGIFVNLSRLLLRQ